MTDGGSSVTAEVVIRGARGLHLRPATQFARIVLAAGVTVRVEANGSAADGSSVLELALLAAGPGTVIRISAEGAGAEDALRSLVAFVSRETAEP